jgi:hypothetical protein
LICVALGANVLGPPANPALAAEATLNVEVPGGQWKGVRLKKLPRGAAIALEIESSDRLRVIVVDRAELSRFPNTRPLFEAIVEKRLGFSVVIPRTDDYYVVFDNRKSDDPRQVRLNVKASAPSGARPPSGESKKSGETRL